jgi:hypothetical protein
MSELHSNFAFPIVINQNVVSDMAPATPKKVKDKWSLLVHELKWKIEKWEMSRQGNGGHVSFMLRMSQVLSLDQNQHKVS